MLPNKSSSARSSPRRAPRSRRPAVARGRRRSRDALASDRVRGRSRREQDRDPPRGREALRTSTSSRCAPRSCAARRSGSVASSAARSNWKKAIVTLARREHRVLRGGLRPMGLRSHQSRPAPGRRGRIAPDFARAHQEDRPREEPARAKSEHAAAATTTAASPRASAAAVTSGATA